MTVQADLERLAGSFRRSLRAANKSERTVDTYLEAVGQFQAFVADLPAGERRRSASALRRRNGMTCNSGIPLGSV